MRWQLDLGRIIDARATFTLLEARKRAAMPAAAAEFEAILAEVRAEQGLPAAPAGEQFEGLDFIRIGDARSRRLRRLQGRATVNRRSFAVLEGQLLAAERRFPEALAAFDRAGGVQTSQQPALLLERGEVLLRMRRLADAEQAFAGVLAIDPLNASARFGLARAALARRDFARAAAEAQAAVGCQFSFPRAHLLAGLALWRAGRVDEAEASLRTAVAQGSGLPAAHRLLAAYLARAKRDFAGAVEHRRIAREALRLKRQWRAGIRPVGRHPLEVRAALSRAEPAGPRVEFTAAPQDCVVVVTSLPRSGTSMMMQMLAAGGVPVLADDRRLADESNPRGYLEFEPVKRLLNDSSWLAQAVGKAVKIVVPLVQQLPRGDAAPPYLVVAMRRPVTEVVRSQRAMLARDGKPGADVPEQTLVAAFERQLITSRTFLAHLESTGRARVLDVAYDDAVANPRRVAQQLATFLAAATGGWSSDEVAAAAAVDPALRRTRR